MDFLRLPSANPQQEQRPLPGCLNCLLWLVLVVPLFKRCHRVHDLLVEHREELECLAQALLEREVLEEPQLHRLVPDAQRHAEISRAHGASRSSPGAMGECNQSIDPQILALALVRGRIWRKAAHLLQRLPFLLRFGATCWETGMFWFEWDVKGDCEGEWGSGLYTE